MIFKELIHKVDREKVKESLSNLYPDDSKKNLEEYLGMLDKLKEMRPDLVIRHSSDRSMIIAVDWYPPEFEFEEEGHYRVHGYEHGKGIFWALEFSPWKKWLGWKVDERFIMIHGEADYVAHCLWEMSYNGFTEEELQERIDLLDGRVDDIKDSDIKLLSHEEVIENLGIEPADVEDTKGSQSHDEVLYGFEEDEED